MNKVFYIIYRTKNGGYRKGRKPFPTMRAAVAYIKAKGIENWKHVARYFRDPDGMRFAWHETTH